MGRTKKNIKFKIPEKPRKIKGFRSGGYRIATTISSRARYDHFDTSPYVEWTRTALLFYHKTCSMASENQKICLIIIRNQRSSVEMIDAI